MHQLGDLLEVRLKNADLVKKQIDFVLAADYDRLVNRRPGSGDNGGGYGQKSRGGRGHGGGGGGRKQSTRKQHGGKKKRRR